LRAGRGCAVRTGAYSSTCATGAADIPNGTGPAGDRCGPQRDGVAPLSPPGYPAP
jgi:hypothetical protein